MNRVQEKRVVFTAFWLAMALNLCVWWHALDVRARWGNVPPVPSTASAALMALGDKQMAYRTHGLLIQNLGDAGGEARPLSDYNYENLTKWFWLEDALDSRANFIPSLAAYYFSANQDTQAIEPIIEYLAEIGQRPGPQKWRWLAQAVYLARFVQHDYDQALVLAEKLAALNEPDMPTWTKQMPAFVMMQQGDKDGAYQILLNILGSQVTHLQAPEINFMREYICDRILSKEEKAIDPICQVPY